jgi:hypothetical protein
LPIFTVVSSLAMAQEQSGGLQGRVVDSSRSALPGVTVTVTGPTIIGNSLTTVTGETGLYRLANIPIGTYRVLFNLSDFQTKAFEGIRVQAGVIFTLDAELGVAAVQEMVTVSGQAPVLDTAATNVSFHYTKELMSTIPNARDVWAMVNQTPGMTSVTLNVGGTNTGNQAQFRALGTDPRQNIFLLNGANVTDNTGGGSQYYFDVDSFEEVQIQTNSHGAEVQAPGVMVNMVPKSGTNALHGNFSTFYGNDSMQSDNVDDALRQRGVDRREGQGVVLGRVPTAGHQALHHWHPQSGRELPDRPDVPLVPVGEGELAGSQSAQRVGLLQHATEGAIQ